MDPCGVQRGHVELEFGLDDAGNISLPRQTRPSHLAVSTSVQVERLGCAVRVRVPLPVLTGTRFDRTHEPEVAVDIADLEGSNAHVPWCRHG